TVAGANRNTALIVLWGAGCRLFRRVGEGAAARIAQVGGNQCAAVQASHVQFGALHLAPYAGRASVGPTVGIVDRTRALVHHHRCTLLGVVRAHPVDAVAERFTMQKRQGGLFRSAFLITQVVGANTNAIEFLDRNNVDHAGYRIGAVQGRAAVQYHSATRDGDVRYEGGDGRVDGAHAIHQGQGAVLAKAAQVEGGACGALRPVSSGVDVGDCIGVLGIGQVADVLTHVRRAGLVQVFLTDSINRGVLGELAV